MTDNEIIKSFESLLDRIRAYECNNASIGKGLIEDTLDLINRLKAQNQEFDEKIIMQPGLIDYQKAEIEKISNLLKLETEGANTLNDVIAERDAEIERLLDRIDQQVTIIGNLEVEVEAMRGAANSYKLHYENAKSEAIKEVADKITKVFLRYAHLHSYAEGARKDYIETVDGKEIEMQSVWDAITLQMNGIAECEEMGRLQKNIETIEKERLLTELEKDFRLLVKETIGE